MYSIYKIEHRTNPELVYVGSTKKFNQRKSQHKFHCISSEIKVYQMIREHGGWDQFDMVELKQIEGTQLEARQEEDRVRIELNAQLNTLSAILDIKLRKKTIQEYHQSHRDEILKRKQGYRQEHLEQIKQQNREYHREHREEIKKKDRERYQAHREELKQKNKEPYTCGCGSQITRGVKARHLKSQKHIMWASI
jgi:hypothetical protein